MDINSIEKTVKRVLLILGWFRPDANHVIRAMERVSARWRTQILAAQTLAHCNESLTSLVRTKIGRSF
jgi:hypothetical protein